MKSAVLLCYVSSVVFAPPELSNNATLFVSLRDDIVLMRCICSSTAWAYAAAYFSVVYPARCSSLYVARRICLYLLSID